MRRREKARVSSFQAQALSAGPDGSARTRLESKVSTRIGTPFSKEKKKKKRVVCTHMCFRSNVYKYYRFGDLSESVVRGGWTRRVWIYLGAFDTSYARRRDGNLIGVAPPRSLAWRALKKVRGLSASSSSCTSFVCAYTG